MRILMVLDQYDNCNNGTTVSAQRFVEGLTKRGHDVYVASTGKQAQNKFVVKELPLPVRCIVACKIARYDICSSYKECFKRSNL